MGSWWNGDEWRWRLSAPTHRPTITVSDISDAAHKEREERVKDGARVVPFGFSRVLAPEPEPLVWEGDNG